MLRSPSGAGALPVGEEKRSRVRAMFDAIAPRYDLLNRLMTGGLDRRWRRLACSALGLASGATVLDVACGTGDMTRWCLAHRHRAVGVDFSRGMLAANRTGAPLVQADAASLPLPDASMDAAVCGYGLRNFTDLDGVLTELARVVRPGGRLALLEIAAPPPGILRTGFRLWFEHAVPLLGAALSDADAYRYLPRSTGYLPPPPALRTQLLEAGFSTVGHRLLSGGLSQLFTATRAGLPAARP